MYELPKVVSCRFVPVECLFVEQQAVSIPVHILIQMFLMSHTKHFHAPNETIDKMVEGLLGSHVLVLHRRLLVNFGCHTLDQQKKVPEMWYSA